GGSWAVSEAPVVPEAPDAPDGGGGGGGGEGYTVVPSSSSLEFGD
ncbi:hypothetical protein Tco_0698208, partial [Tanacetum coccineum]